MVMGVDDAVLAGAGAAAIGGAGDIAGSIYQNSANRAATGKQMRWQDANVQKQMDFQERMAGSAYQRSVADMKKAGLNPMLLASKGFSPQSPSGGSTSSGSAYKAENPGSGLTKSVSSALDLSMMKAQIANTQAQTRSTDAMTRKTVADTPVKELEGGVAGDISDGWNSAKEAAKGLGRWLGHGWSQFKHNVQAHTAAAKGLYTLSK